MSVSSSNSQGLPESPPPKFQKEAMPDGSFHAMAITENWEYSQGDDSSAKSSTESNEDSSSFKQDYSSQNASTNEGLELSSSEAESEKDYMNISRLFMVNVKE